MSFSFILVKISMNVQWVPVVVTKTLIAATVTVLTAVLVKKDSQEMAQRVQVSCSGRDFWECSIEFIFRYETPTIFFLWDLDIDECSTQSSPCNENADCTNNEGSYSCSCKRGFSGDGITCVGQYFRKCSLEFYM